MRHKYIFFTYPEKLLCKEKVYIIFIKEGFIGNEEEYEYRR